MADREETSYEFKCFVKDTELVPNVTRQRAEAAIHPDSLVRRCMLPGITTLFRCEERHLTWYKDLNPTGTPDHSKLL